MDAYSLRKDQNFHLKSSKKTTTNSWEFMKAKNYWGALL